MLAHGSFFWPSINKAIKEVVHQCEACTQFQSQNAAAPLTPTPTPSCPWQMCATDIFTLEGVDHLVVGNFYSKMIFVRHLPPSQSNTNKVISLLKEMFSEHGIPKVLHSDNGPQYANVQFTNFCISWGITHETSSALPTIQWIHQGMHQVCQTCTLTKIQIQLRTTILAKIHNSDPSAIYVCEQIDTCSEAAKAQADKHSKTLALLYAGQPVATYDTLQKIWVPATVICLLQWNSYQVCTSNGSTYCHM